MRITDVKTYSVAGRAWPRYPWVFVEVCTDEGISGFGESTPREGVFEAIDKLAITDVAADTSGIDANDPEPAEIAFLAPAVTGGVGLRSYQGLFGQTQVLTARSTKTFDGIE